MAHDVFISYSSKDKPTADAVCATLEANAIRCWIAPRDIMPGSDWGESLVSAIKGARVMVLVFSAQANFSPQIKREVERAVNAGIPIIPLRIEDVAPSASLEYFISTPHWLDAFTPPLERHLQYLTEVIQKMLGLEPSGGESGVPVDVPETAVPEDFAPERTTGNKSKLVWASVLLILAVTGLAGWWLVHQIKKAPQISPAATSDGTAGTPTNSGSARIEATGDSIASPANKNDQTELWTFTTIAGKAGMRGTTDGVGSEARFDWPVTLAVNKDGNIFVFDRVSLKIRRVNPSGAVTTFASVDASIYRVGRSRFIGSAKVDLDGSGNLYMADGAKNIIMKISPSGMVTTAAGLAGVRGSNDGPAALARFDGPRTIAIAPAGSMFVGDRQGSLLRKIAPDGTVSTVAGQDGSLQTTSRARGSDLPLGVIFDQVVGKRGLLYVVDGVNNIIRVINPGGTMTLLAGQPGIAGSADGTTTNARFKRPTCICADTEGNLYVSDSGNNTIRKITSAGAVTTIGGLEGAAGSADGTGTYARFNNPLGIAMDAQGNIYVADGDNTIRKGHRQTITTSQTH